MTLASATEPRRDPTPEPALVFRAPTVDDGAQMHALVKDSGVLEPNTCYAYLLLATHFADTCLVAMEGDRMLGFVAAYRPPSHPEAVFVWQIGVRAEARGRGLAKRLLHELVERPACAEVTHLEATVDPANEPSCRLFRAFARERGVPCDVSPGFAPHHFTTKHFAPHHKGPAEHPPEDLHRIGPLRRNDS